MDEKTYWANPFYDDIIIFRETLPSSQDKLKPIDLSKGIFQLYEKNNVTEFKKNLRIKLEKKRKRNWPYAEDIFIGLHVSGTKKEIYDKDIDNLLKTIFDTLKGLVFEDDRQVIKLSAEKYISTKLKGVIVAIKKLDSSTGIELFPKMFSEPKDAWEKERQRKSKKNLETYFDFY